MRAPELSEDKILLFSDTDGLIESFGVWVPGPLHRTQPPKANERRPGALVAKGELRITTSQARDIAYLDVGTFRHPILPRTRVWRSGRDELVLQQPSPNKFWRILITGTPLIQARLDVVLSSLCRYEAVDGCSLADPEYAMELLEEPVTDTKSNEYGPSPLVLDAIQTIKQRSIPVSEAVHALDSSDMPQSVSTRVSSQPLPGRQTIPEAFTGTYGPPPPDSRPSSAQSTIRGNSFRSDSVDTRTSTPVRVASESVVRSSTPPLTPSVNSFSASTTPISTVKRASSLVDHTPLPIKSLFQPILPAPEPAQQDPDPLVLQSPENSKTQVYGSPVRNDTSWIIAETPPVSSGLQDHDAFLPSPLATPSAKISNPVFVATPGNEISMPDLRPARKDSSISDSSTLDRALDMFEPDDSDMEFFMNSQSEQVYDVEPAPEDLDFAEDFKPDSTILLEAAGGHTSTLSMSPPSTTPSLLHTDETTINDTSVSSGLWDINTSELGIDRSNVSEATRNTLDEALGSWLQNRSRTNEWRFQQNVRFSHPLIPAAKQGMLYPGSGIYRRDLTTVGTHNFHHDLTTVSGYISWQMVNRVLTTFRRSS